MNPLLRAALAGAVLLPLAACYTYREVPVSSNRPVVVTPAPAPDSGTVVVTPPPRTTY